MTDQQREALTKFVARSLDADDIAEWFANQCSPEEVFSEDSLNDWAVENGYTRPEVPS